MTGIGRVGTALLGFVLTACFHNHLLWQGPDLPSYESRCIMGYSVGLPKEGLNGMEFNAERGGLKPNSDAELKA